MANDKIETYPEAARVIHLWLKEFCDESRACPDMIADASRMASKEIDRLRHLISDEPYNLTMLPGWAQRLWESCVRLSDKAEFKYILRHIENLENRLKTANKANSADTKKPCG